MSTTTGPKSAFQEHGLQKTLQFLKEEIRQLYVGDNVPWILGYSGGKDSTATLQLVWLAISELPQEQRRKPIHVISTDTLVENPVVAAWVTRSLEVMAEAASKAGMPVKPHRLMPQTEDSFWVNLIGKGYPAPRHKFRWCTDRLKIRPSNDFISSIVRQTGEAILVLGTRKAESQARARNMTLKEKSRVRDRLSPNVSLPGSLVYTPIEDWSNDDVWMFLMQVRNPWGYNNKDLLGMYAGASADGECPLVVDSSTPSCGDSRFGCWVCTMVDQDKSMTAMVKNEEELSWMQPLLDLRNAIDFRWEKEPQGDKKKDKARYDKALLLKEVDLQPLKDLLVRLAGKPIEEVLKENWEKYLRDFRRRTGNVQLFHDEPVHGPYKREARECWLRLLLSTQRRLRLNGPPAFRQMEIITLAELQEIRRIWVKEEHFLEDSLPRIYAEATGEMYPGERFDDNLVLGADEMAVLREICGSDELHYEMTRELLSIERQQRASVRRAGLMEKLERGIRRHYYDDKDDAVAMARRYQGAREHAGKGMKNEELFENALTGALEGGETKPTVQP